MTLSADTLAAELEAMPDADQEADAISDLSAAWVTYFEESICAGVSLTGSLSACASAMEAALVGMSASGQGFVKLQAGIVAFWGVVATTAATLWITAPPLVSATPPPGLSGISATLATVGAANVSGKLSKEDSCAAIAAAINTANQGGQGVTAIPTNLPIT